MTKVYLGLILFSLYTSGANDFFADRLVLIGAEITVATNNANCTTEAGELTVFGTSELRRSLWYSWTAPERGVVYINGVSGVQQFALGLITYTGDSLATLVRTIPTIDNGIAVDPGDTIIMQAGTIGVVYPYGPFTITVRLDANRPGSANDAFDNRTDWGSLPYHFEGNILASTLEPNEPSVGNNFSQSLWWKFIPSERQLIHLEVYAGPFSPRLEVFQGSTLDTLIPLSAVSGPHYLVETGQEYAIRVSANAVVGGNFQLNGHGHSLTNDLFSQSERFEGTNFSFQGSLVVATREPGEPPSTYPNTVWSSWAAPSTGRASFQSPWWFPVQVYTGSSLSQLQSVPLTPGFANSVHSIHAIEGTIYHFQLCGETDDFRFDLQLEPIVPASNDHFADAHVIQGNISLFGPVGISDATMELGEPLHLGETPQKSIWLRWQAPSHGIYILQSQSSLVPNVHLAVYQGHSLETLKLVASAATILLFPVRAGEAYYVAAAVPKSATGDIICYAQYNHASNIPVGVPGNILREPSWEGTAILGAQYWHASAGLGGNVNQPGGVDGTTWPVLPSGVLLWQDFTAVLGHSYRVRFASLIGGNTTSCCGEARIRVSLDQQSIGEMTIPENESGYWHWNDFIATATQSTVRVIFENLGRNVEMDDFSVVDLTLPAAIITQPSSVSTVAGGSAAFIVGSVGSAPLHHQWFRDGQPLSGQNQNILFIETVTPEDAGSYTVRVSNDFGEATSTSAILRVESAAGASILVQPYGDTVAAGGYASVSVIALGTPPLFYQWSKNGQPIAGATNRVLEIASVQLEDAGRYEVVVQNFGNTVWSLPATLQVTEEVAEGGMIDFNNRFYEGGNLVEAPVFDIDGVTRLSATNYVAQLYAGPNLESLRPVGTPRPFRRGFRTGLIVDQAVRVPNVPPGSKAVVQVRAWDGSRGNSYEQARALGGKFGRSQLLTIEVGDSDWPLPLIGLRSFQLQVGLPEFNVGRIDLIEHRPDGLITWALRGQAGYSYLVEKSTPPDDMVWRPRVFLTNETGTVYFDDTVNFGLPTALYRARILE